MSVTSTSESGLETGPTVQLFNEDRTRPWRPPLTKILATVGPSIAHPDVVEKVILNGATLFRLNFSHGSFDEHHNRLTIIRAVSAHLGIPVAIVGDLSGPKIRVNSVPGNGIMLRPGQDVIIRPDIKECIDGDTPILGATYANVATEVSVGNRVLVNDGHIRMLCVEADGTQATCRVLVGGLVTTGKGINMPDSTLTIPAVTPKDLECVDWGVEHGLDYFAMSFVRRGAEVRALRQRIESSCEEGTCGSPLDGILTTSRIPVIAKIETPQAVEHIDEILEEADGIMVARGDLGVEMDVATVPVVQKLLVRKAHDYGKPCVVATQMLESMVNSPNATRAEVSDVANAILDGADAVMLSAETAVGRYPHLAVETMRRVALATEQSIRDEVTQPNPPERLQLSRSLMPALAHGAWHMARDVDAKLIVVWSQRGGGARYLSRNGFKVPIIAFSSDSRTVRRMCLLYGVYPVHQTVVPEHRSEFAKLVDQLVLKRGLVQPGDPLVLLGGKPLDRPGSLNTVAIRHAGELVPESH